MATCIYRSQPVPVVVQKYSLTILKFVNHIAR